MSPNFYQLRDILSQTFFNLAKTLFIPLPNFKILDWSNLRAFVDEKIKSAKIVIFVSGRVENIVGKGENAGYQHFLLFPTMSFKGL